MKAVVLVIMCINSGYWYAGRDALVTLQWPDGVEQIDATWQWELKYGQTALAVGEKQLVADQPAQLKIAVPKVRVRTPMSLHWRLVTAGDASLIEAGTISIQVFADDPLPAAIQRLGKRAVAVWSSDQGLIKAITDAGLQPHTIETAGDLATVVADVMIVGPETLASNAMLNQPLIDHARAGATVVVFRHADRPTLLGVDLVSRRIARPPRVRANHTLRLGLTDGDIRSLVGKAARVLRVDSNASDVLVVSDKIQTPDAQTIDALCLVRPIGKGQLVLCQLPLGDWASDPRARQLLSNMFEFSLAPRRQASEKTGKVSGKTIRKPVTGEGVMP